MIGKRIQSYDDYLYYIQSDRWFMALEALAEFKQRDPRHYQEFKKRLKHEQENGESLTRRIEKNW